MCTVRLLVTDETSLILVAFNCVAVCLAPICPTAQFTVAPSDWEAELALWGRQV